MAMTMAQASAAMREAMRETIKRYSTWYLLEGVLLVVAGVVALIWPYVASVALIFLLGWILIISGVLQGIGLIGAKDVPHFWLQLVSAVLAILIGILLLRNPDAGLLIMTVLLIVYFFVEGISKVIFAMNIRPFIGWLWVLLSGIIGILLGAYLWANMPVASEWVLGVLLGIQLIVEGAALALSRLDGALELAQRLVMPGRTARHRRAAIRSGRAERQPRLLAGRRLDIARVDPADFRRGGIGDLHPIALAARGAELGALLGDLDGLRVGRGRHPHIGVAHQRDPLVLAGGRHRHGCRGHRHDADARHRDVAARSARLAPRRVSRVRSLTDGFGSAAAAGCGGACTGAAR